MKRRKMLKQLGFASAAVVATPAVLSLLNSCTTEPKIWQPQFLNLEGGQVLQKLVDVFLPKTELPSASELNIPEFIDRYLNEVYETEEQTAFNEAYAKVLLQLKTDSQKELADLVEKDYHAFLDQHLKTKDEIDTERENNPDFEGLTTSECLDSLKWMCINTYINTEKIGEDVLAYDPVPGEYYCGDLDELTQGKRWSLMW